VDIEGCGEECEFLEADRRLEKTRSEKGFYRGFKRRGVICILSRLGLEVMGVS
jgi:hypothetical protein